MNLSPSTAHPSDRLDILRTLAPVSRAIGLARIAHGLLIGFAAGAAVGAGVLVAAHIWALGVGPPAGALVAVAGLVAGVAFGVARWPRALEAARAADLQLDLNDRLTTALELRSSHSPVAVLQRRDVAQRIDGLALARRASPLWPPGRWLGRREGAAIGLAAVALVGALALGTSTRGPATHAAAAHSARHSTRAQRAAADRLRQLTAKLQAGLTPDQRRTAAMRKLDLALAQLRRQLEHATTPRAALRAISATQQQLRQLAQGLHPINSKAVAQLNSSLGKNLGQGQTGNKSQASTRSALAMSQALNRLAQSLAHLSPAQRAALAQALARAANASSNTGLRSSLRQAASALANGDIPSARAALQQAVRALAQSSAMQAALSRLGAAGSQLGSLKNQLSGSAQSGQAGSSNSGRSLQGTGRGQQAGTRQGSGTRLGTGKGSGNGHGFRLGQGRGQGQGGRQGTPAGRGNAPGRGAQGRRASGHGGTGSGNRAGQTAATTGTSGARGNGGRGRQATLSRRGRNVTVYVAGKQGKGPQTVLTGPNGAPLPGAYVPYQQVVSQYTQSAHQALDRGALPPSIQGYVRRYFSSISQ